MGRAYTEKEDQTTATPGIWDEKPKKLYPYSSGYDIHTKFYVADKTDAWLEKLKTQWDILQNKDYIDIRVAIRKLNALRAWVVTFAGRESDGPRQIDEIIAILKEAKD